MATHEKAHHRQRLHTRAIHALRAKRDKVVLSAVIILALVVAVEAAVLALGEKEMGFIEYAQKVVEKCSGSNYKPGCYDEEIPKLMDRLSMEDAFEVTRQVQEIDPSYQYCHVLGHKLSAQETAKDPSEWRSVITRCPSGLCSNGCIHGAFQERFRKESLTDEELALFKPQFADVCEAREGFSPTSLEQASCYHALGHLFMYVTGADIDGSLALCKELTVKGNRDYSQLCFDGSFMQIFQPLEPDDFALIEGKEVDRSEVEGFCSQYSGRERGSCWSEAWPLFREELSDPKNIVAHCDRLDSQAEEKRCFNALTYVLAAQIGFDQDKIGDYCARMPEGNKANCFAQAASRLIETDYRNGPQSVALCERAKPYDKDDACFNELLKYSTYNFHVGSDAFVSFCGSMPEPWKSRCLSGTSNAQ